MLSGLSNVYYPVPVTQKVLSGHSEQPQWSGGSSWHLRFSDILRRLWVPGANMHPFLHCDASGMHFTAKDVLAEDGGDISVPTPGRALCYG